MTGTGARSRLRAAHWGRPFAILVIAILVLAAGLMALAARGGLVVRGLDGCPRTIGSFTSVSWVDVLHVEGRTYVRVDGPDGDAEVPAGLVGARIDTVDCAIADAVQAPGYDFRDGEATFLARGTPVHELLGFDPGFRVLAGDGPAVVYEHVTTSGARSGADVIPVTPQQVVGVTFRSAEDGRRVLGRLAPSAVRTFVNALRAGPIDLEARPGGEAARILVDLELTKQPPFTVVVYTEVGITTDGVRLFDDIEGLLPEPG